MKKKFLVAAGAAVLALGMSVSAMAEVVTSDKDYGAEGSATESPAGWGSNINGQFAIKDKQKLTFKFDSKSTDSSNPVFGWVAEITDDTSYFTITQGGTGWFAPDTAEWKTSGKNNFEVKKSWEDDSVYATAVADSKNVELTVTRSGKQIIFESKAKGSDGVDYTLKITGIFDSALAETLKVQVGCDHGSMVLYSVKYEDAGEVGTPPPTKEVITAKPNLNNKAGLADDSSSEEDDSSNTGLIIGVVVAVLVVAVVVGVVVATKKKSN